jgi:anti-anti-sigma factor
MTGSVAFEDHVEELAPLRARLRAARGHIVVEFAGDLDLAGERVARGAIEAAWQVRERRLVLDLSACRFMGANGVMLLLAAQARAEESGRELSLRVGPPARRVLELCGVLSRFSLAPG